MVVNWSLPIHWSDHNLEVLIYFIYCTSGHPLQLFDLKANQTQVVKMFALGYILVMHFTYILISLVFYINYISICWKWAGIEEKNRNLFSFMLFAVICLMLVTRFHSHFSKMQVIQFCSFLETDSTICFPLITLDSLGIHINQCICTTNMAGKSV